MRRSFIFVKKVLYFRSFMFENKFYIREEVLYLRSVIFTKKFLYFRSFIFEKKFYIGEEILYSRSSIFAKKLHVLVSRSPGPSGYVLVSRLPCLNGAPAVL